MTSAGELLAAVLTGTAQTLALVTAAAAACVVLGLPGGVAAFFLKRRRGRRAPRRRRGAAPGSGAPGWWRPAYDLGGPLPFLLVLAAMFAWRAGAQTQAPAAPALLVPLVVSGTLILAVHVDDRLQGLAPEIVDAVVGRTVRRRSTAVALLLREVLPELIEGVTSTVTRLLAGAVVVGMVWDRGLGELLWPRASSVPATALAVAAAAAAVLVALAVAVRVGGQLLARRLDRC